jgi:CBS domain-containing protein
MNVGQLMSVDVVSLEAGSTLDLADDLMRLKRIRHLPVLAGERLIGLVSQRDLFRAGLSSVLEFRRHAAREWLSQVRVDEAMVSDLVTVSPETDVEEAVGLMIERKIGCLPVTSQGKLVGLLSETDCLRYLRHILAIADVKRSITELGPVDVA